MRGKHVLLFEAFAETKKKLSNKQYDFITRNVRGSWKQNEKGEIDVKGKVDIKSPTLTKIPVQFGTITEGFYLRCKKLTSLVGSPHTADLFFCSDCHRLSSLEGCPQNVTNNFSVNDAWYMPSLKGAPERVPGNFRLMNARNLKSLEGGPKFVGESFYLSDGRRITTLKGAPEIGGDFVSHDLVSLNPEEKQLLEFPEILKEWFKEGTPDLKQFTHKYRGKLLGHKFGF